MEKMQGMLPKVVPDYIMELTHAVERTEVIYNACQLRLFDTIEKLHHPATVQEVAERLNLHTDMLHRLMNACVALGLLNKERDIIDGAEREYFTNTPVAASYLVDGSDFSLLSLVAAARHQFDLDAMIKSGETDTSRRWFTRLEDNERAYKEMPERFSRYYLKQDGYARSALHLLKTFDLKKHKTCVDLGGGIGSMSRALMLMYHGMKVACVDFPKVIEFAKQVEASRGHMKINHANTLREFEVNYTAADMWSDPLPKADLYLLSHMLHMYDDEQCATLLKKVYDNTNKDGAILIMEKVLKPGRDGPETATLYDLRMMGSSEGGKERTFQQYVELLTHAGFHYVKFYENDGFNVYDVIYAQRSTTPDYKIMHMDVNSQ